MLHPNHLAVNHLQGNCHYHHEYHLACTRKRDQKGNKTVPRDYGQDSIYEGKPTPRPPQLQNIVPQPREQNLRVQKGKTAIATLNSFPGHV